MWLSTLGLSWLGMLAVHELGHVIHAVASGGAVARVVLDPRELSRTDYALNPRPLVTAWGGVLWGTAIPLAAFALARRRPWAHLLRFFAGSCATANGAYLAAGALARAGDPGELIALGMPAPALAGAGLIVGGCGLALWHGLGARFGLGPGAARVEPRLAAWLAALLAALVLVELATTAR